MTVHLRTPGNAKALCGHTMSANARWADSKTPDCAGCLSANNGRPKDKRWEPKS